MYGAVLCRVISFLCDLTHMALQMEHARAFPDDQITVPANTEASSESTSAHS